jgi:transposase-like protein
MPARPLRGPPIRGAGDREMKRIARKSDGRRIFTDEFKRRQIRRLWRGQLTVADLGRKLGIARSLLQRWKRLFLDGALGTGGARRRSAPTTGSGASPYVRELQMLVGRQTAELELLRAELVALRKSRPTRVVPAR